jgi:hypothetical protein
MLVILNLVIDRCANYQLNQSTSPMRTAWHAAMSPMPCLPAMRKPSMPPQLSVRSGKNNGERVEEKGGKQGEKGDAAVEREGCKTGLREALPGGPRRASVCEGRRIPKAE